MWGLRNKNPADALQKNASSASANDFGSPSRANRKQAQDPLEEEASISQPLPRLVEDCLEEINMTWEYLGREDFNPVPFALNLIEPRSAKELDLFQKFEVKMEDAMDLIVNDYHAAFNSSIHTFSNVVEYIGDSQKRVRDMRNQLISCRRLLQVRRMELLDLWVKSVEHKEMLRIFDTIEELKAAPAKLEKLMAGKYWLSATRTLLNALKLLSSPEIQPIEALSDIRRTLETTRTTIYDILIEELHNHLYLKSPYSMTRVRQLADSLIFEEPVRGHRKTQSVAERLRSNANKRTSGRGIESFAGSLQGNSANPGGGHARASAHRRALSNGEAIHVNTNVGSHTKSGSISAGDMSEELQEDLESDPEIDSFNYMLIIVESVRLLGKVHEMLDVIQQRKQTELFYVIERAINEIDPSDYFGRRWQTENTPNPSFAFSGLTLIDASGHEDQGAMLRDLMKVIFERFETVLMGHASVRTFLLNSADRGTISFVYALSDIWRAMETELQSFAMDYLNPRSRDFAGAGGIPPILAMNEVMLEKSRKRRERTKNLFRMPTTITNNFIKDRLFAIENMLQRYEANDNSGRGAISPTPMSPFSSSNTMLATMNHLNSSAPTTHNLLIEPDPYYIVVLHTPLTEFSGRMGKFTQSFEMTIRAQMDEFVKQVFLPMMEDKILAYFQLHVYAEDGFTPQDNGVVGRPILKSALALVSLINSMSRTLTSIPVHKEEFLAIMELVLINYYERCFTRMRALMASDDMVDESTISSQWVEVDAVRQVLRKNPCLFNDSPTKSEPNSPLAQEEIQLEMQLKNERSFHRSELIFDHKKLASLAALHFSLIWLVAQIQGIRARSDSDRDRMSSPTGSGRNEPEPRSFLEEMSMYRDQFSTESLPGLVNLNPDDMTKLPLSEEMAIRFDYILQNLSQIAETCLFVVRLELRCHTIFFLDLAIREGNYTLEHEPFGPDAYISVLTGDLATSEEVLSDALPERLVRFLFDGLSDLMAHILISNQRHIRRINRHGNAKMIRNVMALQQSLTNMNAGVNEKSLDRARLYYELYFLGGEGLLKYIDLHGAHYTEEEYLRMLDLIYEDALQDSDTYEASRIPFVSTGDTVDIDKLKKEYSDCKAKLKEWFAKSKSNGALSTSSSQ